MTAAASSKSKVKKEYFLSDKNHYYKSLKCG